MKIIPCYLYGVNSVPEVGDGSLFHYTKFESLIKILETMTLRSSPLSKMNDLNEADLSGLDWSKDFLQMFHAQEYVRTQCSVISFTQNYEVDFICREGANHPAMWAHYAENSEGACIVLDKTALIENNLNRFRNVFYKLEEVEYTCDHSPRAEVTQGDCTTASDFVHLNYRELFFKKDIDWKSEGEVRLLVESPEWYLDIMDSVKYIVLGNRLIGNTSRMQELVSLIYSSDVLKDYFSPHSFATVLSSQGGYFIHDASHHVVQCLKELNEASGKQFNSKSHED